MSIVLPTPDEYARMSWAARTRTIRRLHEIERSVSNTTIEEARAILATLPRDPEWVCAMRLGELAHAARPRISHNKTQRTEIAP